MLKNLAGETIIKELIKVLLQKARSGKNGKGKSLKFYYKKHAASSKISINNSGKTVIKKFTTCGSSTKKHNYELKS